MRRGIRFAARALVAAGALALSGHYVQARPSAPVLVANDGVAENRLIVLNVRLAWLADPAVAAFPLGIRTAGADFEVCGFVPDDTARARALQIARTVSGHKVHDELILNTTLHAHVATHDDDKLAKAAASILKSQMKIDGLVVNVVSPGRVQIMGTVRSVEERVLASHKLLLVPNCTCAVNNLMVQTLASHGQEYTAVSADGQLMVPGPVGNDTGLESMATEPARKVSTVTRTPQVDKPATTVPTQPAAHAPVPTPPAPKAGSAVADTPKAIARADVQATRLPSSGPALPAIDTTSSTNNIILASKSEPAVPMQTGPQQPYAVAKSLTGIERTPVVAEAQAPGVAKTLSGIERNPVVGEATAPVTPASIQQAMPSEDHPVISAAPLPASADGASDDEVSWPTRMLAMAAALHNAIPARSPAAIPPIPMPRPGPDMTAYRRPVPAVTPLTKDGKWPSAYGAITADNGPSIPTPSSDDASPALPAVDTSSVPSAEPNPMPVMSEPKARPLAAEPAPAPPELKLAPTMADQLVLRSEMKAMPMPTTPEPITLPQAGAQVAAVSTGGQGFDKTQGTVPTQAAPTVTTVPMPHEEPVSPAFMRIKNVIEAQCGSDVARVLMHNQSDHTVVVQIYLAKAASEKPVTEKLLHMPEVAQPGVTLELKIPVQ